jgi:uncharacterized membrane protein
MLSKAMRLHKFLLSQMFYPLVLSSLLALAFYVARVPVSHSWRTFSNMIWNLFLAWMPYVFSIMTAVLYRWFPRRWWLLILPGALWLLFFPNAPYIVTDFFHLRERIGIPLWYDILLLITFSLTGLFLAIVSLKSMQMIVGAYRGRFLSWVFVTFSLGLCGIGIYLGRFEHWNSWDLLSHPLRILRDIAVRLVNPAENFRFFGFTLLFTVFLVVCYVMFISMRNMEVEDFSAHTRIIDSGGQNVER